MKLSNDLGMPKGYKCNGCGSGWLAKYTPNTIYFVSVFEACRIHDYAYEVGVAIEDKWHADREFRNNLVRIVTNVGVWYYPTKLALHRADVYYEVVKNFGGPAFWKGK